MRPPANPSVVRRHLVLQPTALLSFSGPLLAQLRQLSVERSKLIAEGPHHLVELAHGSFEPSNSRFDGLGTVMFTVQHLLSLLR